MSLGLRLAPRYAAAHPARPAAQAGRAQNHDVEEMRKRLDGVSQRIAVRAGLRAMPKPVDQCDQFAPIWKI